MRLVALLSFLLIVFLMPVKDLYDNNEFLRYEIKMMEMDLCVKDKQIKSLQVDNQKLINKTLIKVIIPKKNKKLIQKPITDTIIPIIKIEKNDTLL